MLLRPTTSSSTSIMANFTTMHVVHSAVTMLLLAVREVQWRTRVRDIRVSVGINSARRRTDTAGAWRPRTRSGMCLAWSCLGTA